MNATDFVNLCRSKRAAALMTPEAMQAAAQPPAGAPPMDPAAMGGMPPAGAPPMDPAAMGGMPPAGAPPMDPAAMGGMPPAGPQMDPAALQQMFIEFAASQGITLDPQTGGAFDANGQPVPPQVIQQLMMQFEQMLMQSGGMPPAGATPMDPAAMGGMPPAGAPPMDPAMMGAPAGAPPMDPAAMGGMPPEAMPPAPDPAAMIEEVRNGIESMVKAELSAQDNKIAAIMQKLDTVKGLLEQLVGTKDQRKAEDKAAEQGLDAMLQQQLAAQSAQQPQVAPVPPAVDQLQPKQASVNKSLTLLQKMRGING